MKDIKKKLSYLKEEEDEEEIARQLIELEVSIEQLKKYREKRQGERVILPISGLILFFIWAISIWYGYPGCGLVLIPVGIGLFAIWGVETFIAKVTYEN